MATPPSGYSSKPPVTIQQSFSVLPEEKKDKPVPGQSLYTETFTLYRLMEQATLAYSSPVMWGAGLACGFLWGCKNYYNIGAPKKISGDSQIIDFGALVHSKGLSAGMTAARAKYTGVLGLCFLDTLYQASPIPYDPAIDWLTFGARHSFVFVDAFDTTNELVQRISRLIDHPPK